MNIRVLFGFIAIWCIPPSGIIMSQVPQTCVKSYSSYILPSGDVCNSAVRTAMDSCVDIAHKCQFCIDGIKPEVIVRPIHISDYVVDLCFNIKAKDGQSLPYLLDLYGSSERIALFSCRYREISFIFCMDTTAKGMIISSGSFDTICYGHPVRSYQFTTIDDARKINSKSSNMIEGYVFLHLDKEGNWWLNTMDCTKVDADKLLFEDEHKRIYRVIREQTFTNNKGFSIVE